MESILLVILAIYIFRTSLEKDNYVKIDNLKLGTNKKGLCDKTAFTEVYMTRKETRKNAKEV